MYVLVPGGCRPMPLPAIRKCQAEKQGLDGLAAIRGPGAPKDDTGSYCSFSGTST